MPIRKNCRICNKEYFHKPSKINSKYCSVLCGNRGKGWAQKVKLNKQNCLTCLKEFEYYHWDRKNAQFCSKKCKGDYPKWERKTEKEKIEIIQHKYNKFVVKNENGCWGWNGAKINTGYGLIRYGSRPYIYEILAHRASWILNFGEIPKGMFVLHKCDNPECSAPTCLFLGTQKDNSKDMWAKNRAAGYFKLGTIPSNRRFNEYQIKEIREKLKNGIGCWRLGKEYKVDKSIIMKIKNNKTYREII